MARWLVVNILWKLVQILNTSFPHLSNYHYNTHLEPDSYNSLVVTGGLCVSWLVLLGLTTQVTQVIPSFLPSLPKRKIHTFPYGYI